MPYFTKKGSGKDKNKVCVYKKSDKKKVGCTAGPIEKYLTALRMAESGDFDFINDTDSLNGVRFTIGLSTIPNIIYTIEDDGQDHRVTVSWNEKEHLLIDRDENYDSIKWIINTNIRRKGDTLRLFNKYFTLKTVMKTQIKNKNAVQNTDIEARTLAFFPNLTIWEPWGCKTISKFLYFLKNYIIS